MQLEKKKKNIILQSFLGTKIIKRKHRSKHLSLKNKKTERRMLDGHFEPKPRLTLKKLQTLASHFLWSIHTNVSWHTFLNRAKCIHKSICKYNPLFQISGLTQKQFEIACKGQPMVTDSLKAFSSAVAPLDGTLGSINTWLSSMSNPKFFILVRYGKIEQVACVLAILWKVYNKSFKNSWIEVW